MKKRHKKKSIRFISFLILFIIIYMACNKFMGAYAPVGKKSNSNYSGIGQEAVEGKDGYFTTFTTENSHKKTYLEYKQNWTSSWAKNEYWGGTMEENGCGITSMSIILSGYGMDYSPEVLRKKYFPKLNYANLSKELSNNFGIENSDFLYANVYWSEKKARRTFANKQTYTCMSIC